MLAIGTSSYFPTFLPCKRTKKSAVNVDIFLIIYSFPLSLIYTLPAFTLVYSVTNGACEKREKRTLNTENIKPALRLRVLFLLWEIRLSMRTESNNAIRTSFNSMLFFDQRQLLYVPGLDRC